MDSISQKAQAAELKKRFHGRTEAKSKYTPKYPASVERDYLRLMNHLISDGMRAALQENMAELLEVLRYAEATERADAKSQKEKNREKRSLERAVTLAEVAPRLKSIMDKIAAKLESVFGLNELTRRLRLIANANRKLTIREWKKAIGRTLGINILDDFYDGAFYEGILEQWVKDNVDLIQTIPHDTLGRMQEVVLKSYLDGKSVTEIAKDIQKEYRTTKSHARLLARDQVGKLNAQITKHQQESAGVKKYIWRTAGDGRVRDSHRELNNTTHSWDDPPVVDRKTGRRAHPGEDYQCRCVALPVFDFEELDIPADGRQRTDQKGKSK